MHAAGRISQCERVPYASFAVCRMLLGILFSSPSHDRSRVFSLSFPEARSNPHPSLHYTYASHFMSGNLQSFHLIYRRPANRDGGMRFEYIKRTPRSFLDPLSRIRVDVAGDEAFRDERKPGRQTVVLWTACFLGGII